MSHLFLGIDGGGSRCRARLETLDGRVLGRGLAGPASMRFGFEAARESIMAATRQALEQAKLNDDALKTTFAGIGLAGAGHRGARDKLDAWRHPFAGAWFEGDAYLGFLGAFGGAQGGVVIAGTGSIGIAYLDKTVRVGGYGFPVSDEGGGADLGLNALQHALRTFDGRADASDFSSEVLARFSNDADVLIGWMERASATDYATLAPIVVRHAAAGDAAARRLLRQASSRIGELVEALFRSGAPQVALLGGLADFMQAYMPLALAARLTPPQADAMAGGIMLAKAKLAASIAPAGPSP